MALAGLVTLSCLFGNTKSQCSFVGPHPWKFVLLQVKRTSICEEILIATPKRLRKLCCIIQPLAGNQPGQPSVLGVRLVITTSFDISGGSTIHVCYCCSLLGTKFFALCFLGWQPSNLHSGFPKNWREFELNLTQRKCCTINAQSSSSESTTQWFLDTVNFSHVVDRQITLQLLIRPRNHA